MSPRRGLQDGGDRTAALARWLRDVPEVEAVQELVLLAWIADEPPEVMRRWPKARVSRELATEINELILDHAIDNGTTAHARLSWMHSTGEPWLSKGLRAYCPRGDQEAVMPLDGSQQSLLSSNQRHTEAAFQALIQYIDRNDAKFVDLVDRGEARYERMFGFMDRMLERLDARAQEAEEVADNAAEQIAHAEAIADEATQVAEGAMERAEANADDDKVARVFDIALRKLSEG